ncbi:flagellin [Hyphomicrobium sulfonivorans]|uniref:flagellin N-terminal helical domain-containing protein n=1 Tax=Hyphomicrobium sulfonivorans TaxID=121290 RepID=UPI00156E4751|nr:flagellin [Hyphomicrobium sulfonivorans]MBI1648775.1 flagellin [Hyphomicrobium sulfonivorans]NSL70690.1 flagellin [Hyphomicrobium sulfonivorans]
MASINTNVAAMTALRALTATNSSLVQTQSRISTGMRVNTAADNAAYWSIATTLRSDSSSLSTVQDALGLGAAFVDVAYTAMDEAKNIMTKIKDKLVAAAQPGLDRGKIQTEITELQSQLKGMSDAATLQGQNWLSVDSEAAGYNATKKIVSSIARSGGSISVQSISIDTSSMVLFDASTQDDGVGIIDAYRDGTTGERHATQPGTPAATDFRLSTMNISTLTDSAAHLATLDGYIKAADLAISEMAAGATTLGAAKARIDIQQSFVSSLKNSIESGISQLVDADMNAESTRLQALQVKQQLGIQALAIANSSSQSILSLFR